MILKNFEPLTCGHRPRLPRLPRLPRPIIGALLFIAALGSAASAHAQTPTAEEIMNKAFEVAKLDGSEMVAELSIYNARGQVRVRKLATVGKLFDDGKTEKRLARFIAPPDVKGTGLLTFDHDKKTDDMWFYMPALRKTRRIVSSEKAKSFMGSEFSYADITPPPVEDFAYKVLGSESVDGVDCWKIESRPKTQEIAEENGYSRRVGYVGKADYTLRKATFFDLDGELHKELIIGEVREVDTVKHRYRPMHMVMVSKQNKRRSEFKISKIQARTDIPDEYFTVRYLERE